MLEKGPYIDITGKPGISSSVEDRDDAHVGLLSDEPETLRALAVRLEQSVWHPSVELAGSLVRAAASALEQAGGQTASVTDIRKGLLAAEQLFKLRGAQLVESNLIVAQRLRTEWELGRMLQEQAPHGGDRRSSTSGSNLIRLRDLGISNWQSSAFRHLAEIDRDDLEHWISEDANDRELSTAAALAQWRAHIRDQAPANDPSPSTTVEPEPPLPSAPPTNEAEAFLLIAELAGFIQDQVMTKQVLIDGQVTRHDRHCTFSADHPTCARKCSLARSLIERAELLG